MHSEPLLLVTQRRIPRLQQREVRNRPHAEKNEFPARAQTERAALQEDEEIVRAADEARAAYEQY